MGHEFLTTSADTLQVMKKTLEADQLSMPSTNSGANDLFVGAMALNRMRFDKGYFDDAYHALVAALHLAEIVGGEDGSLQVERVAGEQLTWINQYACEYQHSCASTAQRGDRTGNIWEGLAMMAHMRVRALRAKLLVAIP